MTRANATLVRVYAIALVLIISLISISCESKPETAKTKPAEPRIISLSPNITEIIFALGAGDMLVGDTDYCDYPPEAKLKTRVGGVLDTNFEAIVGLKPDVIIDLGSQKMRIAKLQELGLNVFIVSNETIDDIYDAIESIGNLLHKEGEARMLSATLQVSMAEITDRVANTGTPSVAFVSDHTPGTLGDAFVAGDGNFINDMITMAGGKNIFDHVAPGYPQVSIEAFLKLDPEFIFDATQNPGDPYAELHELQAVKNSHVFFCRSIVQVPGPRMPITLKYFAEHLHPEAFSQGPKE